MTIHFSPALQAHRATAEDAEATGRAWLNRVAAIGRRFQLDGVTLCHGAEVADPLIVGNSAERLFALRDELEDLIQEAIGA
jgi:hypothetical protein